MRSAQREAIRLDPDWLGGDYPKEKPPINGMRLARKMGVVTYRSPVEWNDRFGRKRIERAPADSWATRFEIESYLEHQAEKFVNRFDANCYLYLSRAMDLFDLGDHGTSIVDALSKLRACRTRVIGVESDISVPGRAAGGARRRASRGGRGVLVREAPLHPGPTTRFSSTTSASAPRSGIS